MPLLIVAPVAAARTVAFSLLMFTESENDTTPMAVQGERGLPLYFEVDGQNSFRFGIPPCSIHASSREMERSDGVTAAELERELERNPGPPENAICKSSGGSALLR